MMENRMCIKKRMVVLACFCCLMSGCAFHSTATNWHGLTGVDGEPAYYKKTSKVAMNLLVVIPFAGNVGVGGMVEDLTEAIAEEGGNNVRIVQGSSENYWYGFPPFTWVLTPVVTTVSAEYTPSPEIYQKDQEEIRKKEAEQTMLNPQNW